MKVYFVTTGLWEEIQVVKKVRPPRLLCSYWYFKNKRMADFCEELGYRPEIILDSGAYSAFTKGKNALFNFSVLPEQQPTLTAKGPGAVCARYIVRRLTPTECARLQGFPDDWGHIPHKESLTDEEYRFWLDVRNTHATINGRAAKEYTEAQMLSWYNKLHTDSAEYKMWGNGIALPNALYVMQGIAAQLQNQNKG